MKLRIIVVVGAALTTLALGAISLPRSKPAPREARVSSPDVAGERTPPEAPVASSTKQNSSPRMVQAPSTSAVAAASPSKPVDDEAEAAGEATNSIERQQHDVEKLTRSFEARFASETFDPGWSHSMEHTLRSELVTKATGSTVLESSCATTMCRIVLRHETREAQRQLAYTVSELAPFRAGVFYAYGASADPPRTTLYVMRQGHEFKEVSGS